MKVIYVSKSLITAMSVVLCVLSLVACGGGGSKKSPPSAPSSVLLGGVIQGIPMNLTTEVSTIAGAYPYRDGQGAQARFNHLSSGVKVGDNLYVVDGSRIRRISVADGTTVTVTSSLQGYQIPSNASLKGIAGDFFNLYVSDAANHTIIKIAFSTGVATLLAGKPGQAGAFNGSLLASTFNQPWGLHLNDNGNLLVADYGNHVIRNIDLIANTVGTLAGVAGQPGSVDSTDPFFARFNGPRQITRVNGSDLPAYYVTDYFNHTIRQLYSGSNPNGRLAVTTLAGKALEPGNADGPGLDARFRLPDGIAYDAASNKLLISDAGNHTIRTFDLAPLQLLQVQTVAGTAEVSGPDNGIGASAQFFFPRGLVMDGTKLYIMDGLTSVRELNINTRAVITFAGAWSAADGIGAASRFDRPIGITTDGTYLYVVDGDNFTIRKIVISSGAVTTLAGKPGFAGHVDGTGVNARFNFPHSITTDGAALYLTSFDKTIRRIDATSGEVTTIGGENGVSGDTDAVGFVARFNDVTGITTDGKNLYIVDGNAIRKMVIATKAVTTIAGSVLGPNGNENGIGSAATFNDPIGITTNGTHLFVADTGNRSIRKIVIATGEVSTLTSNFGNPTLASLSTDGTNLYAADFDQNVIFKIVIATGVVTQLAGRDAGVADGSGLSGVARFDGPWGITNDAFNLYITDYLSGTVRKMN